MWLGSKHPLFSSYVPRKSHHEATRFHEETATDLIEVKPGDKVLDVGRGIGGLMRAIIVYSRCNIVGITINEYYVNQACALNKNASLDLHYEVVPGDFLEMLFDDNSFEGAYSIEATCHAQKLEDGYAEVFRVLKLRTLYVSYKRVTTDKHNTRNPEHMVIIQGIKRGDALPGLRHYTNISEIDKKVGMRRVYLCCPQSNGG